MFEIKSSQPVPPWLEKMTHFFKLIFLIFYSQFYIFYFIWFSLGHFSFLSEVCSSFIFFMRFHQKQTSSLIVRPRNCLISQINKIEFENSQFLFAEKIMIMSYPLYIFVSEILLFGTKIAKPELSIH